jgi:hypothetical protein
MFTFVRKVPKYIVYCCSLAVMMKRWLPSSLIIFKFATMTWFQKKIFFTRTRRVSLSYCSGWKLKKLYEWRNKTETFDYIIITVKTYNSQSSFNRILQSFQKIQCEKWVKNVRKIDFNFQVERYMKKQQAFFIITRIKWDYKERESLFQIFFCSVHSET